MVSQKSDLTFKHNLKHGRHGWLRLTPAYSVKIVGDILERVGEPQRVLDPFSGTGTTGLVCAERGVIPFAFNAETVQIPPAPLKKGGNLSSKRNLSGGWGDRI